MNHLCFGVAWIVLLCLQTVLRADNFVHDFGTRTVDCAAFVAGFNAADKTVDLRKGLRFHSKQGDGPMQSQGIKTVFAIRGDGSAELRFRCAALGKPTQGWGSGVQLRAEFNDPEKTGLTVAVRAEKDGNQYMIANFTSGGQKKHSVERWKIEKLPISQPIIMRFERLEDQVSVAFDVGEGMVTKKTKTVSTTDAFPVAVWVGTGDGSADLDVTLESLSIMGASLAGDTRLPAPPLSLWTVVFWLFLLAAMITIGLRVYPMVRGPESG